MDRKDLRIKVIGAHPDDPEVNMAGTIAKFAESGARVRMVSVSCGDKGHRVLPPKELAERRYGETQTSARTLGAERYVVLDGHDCELEATMAPERGIRNRVPQYRAGAGRLNQSLEPHLRVFRVARRFEK
ncbi:MAG: PIG-L family deacetylase [Kiritimatiellae bacterium]|nr:PIG-L family deacetylase [Kiritimatiellia bacterium]